MATGKAGFKSGAADALDWWTAKMPEDIYQSFKSQMETATRDVMKLHGFDDDLLRNFDVKEVYQFKR